MWNPVIKGGVCRLQQSAFLWNCLLSILAFPLLSWAQDFDSSQQSCARLYENRIVASCAPNQNTQWDAVVPRLAIASMLHECVGDGLNSRPRSLRIVGPDSTFTQALVKLTSSKNNSFSVVTGIPINYTILPSPEFNRIRPMLLRNPRPPSAFDGYDAIVVLPSAYGDADQVPGKLIDLSLIVANDRTLQWEDFQPALRSATVTYDGAIVALPLLPVPFITFYRMDIFERDGLTPPRTWDEFLDLAERYHMGPDGLVGACTWTPGCRAESFALRYILASFVQTHGPGQGLLWDAQTLNPLFGTPAMEAALRVMRRLRSVSLNVSTYGTTCIPRDFNLGSCLLSITDPGSFKKANMARDPMRGKMGMAPLPGSTRVLDRATNQLVDCNAKRCPLAIDSITKDGKTIPVNRSPVLVSTVVMFNGLSPNSYQFLAYTLFAHLTSPDVIGASGFLLEDNDVLPVRQRDIVPGMARLWVERGYDPGDVDRFLKIYEIIGKSENHNIDLKTSFATNVTLAMLRAGTTATNLSIPEDVAIRAAIIDLDARLTAIVATEGKESFAQQYRRSLNWVRPQSAGGGDAGQASSDPGVPVVTVAVPATCGGAILVACVLAAVLLWRRRRRAAARSVAAELQRPPEVSPSTTLVVTDIQDSTVLWEALDAQIMDEALRVHHRVIREGLLAHSGYESATEGDSFILAFHSPQHAVCFCLEAQQALLEAHWAPGLIHRAPLPSVKDPCDDPAGIVLVSQRSLPSLLLRSKLPGKLRPGRTSPPKGLTRNMPAIFMRRGVQAAPSSVARCRMASSDASYGAATDRPGLVAAMNTLLPRSQPPSRPTSACQAVFMAHDQGGPSGAPSGRMARVIGGTGGSACAGGTSENNNSPLPIGGPGPHSAAADLPTGDLKGSSPQALQPWLTSLMRTGSAVEVNECVQTPAHRVVSLANMAVSGVDIKNMSCCGTDVDEAVHGPGLAHDTPEGQHDVATRTVDASDSLLAVIQPERLDDGEEQQDGAAGCATPVGRGMGVAVGGPGQEAEWVQSAEPACAVQRWQQGLVGAGVLVHIAAPALARPTLAPPDPAATELRADLRTCTAESDEVGAHQLSGRSSLPTVPQLLNNRLAQRSQPLRSPRLRPSLSAAILHTAAAKQLSLRGSGLSQPLGDSRSGQAVATAVDIIMTTGGPPAASAVAARPSSGMLSTSPSPFQEAESGHLPRLTGQQEPLTPVDGLPCSTLHWWLRQQWEPVGRAKPQLMPGVMSAPGTGTASSTDLKSFTRALKRWIESTPGTAQPLISTLSPVDPDSNLSVNVPPVSGVHSCLLSATPIPSSAAARGNMCSGVSHDVSEGGTREAPNGSRGGPRHRTSQTGMEPQPVVVFRGLRVRMGCVCTVYPGTDARRNQASGRMQYGGMSLRLAKAVSDAAHGGMVLLSDCVYAALSSISDPLPAVAAASGGPRTTALQHMQLVWLGEHVLSEDLPPMHLIQAMTHGSVAAGRLALQRPPRSIKSLLPPGPSGVLAAPMQGYATVARVSVVGAATLLAWNVSVATTALKLLHEAQIQALVSSASTDDLSSPYVAEGVLGLSGRAVCGQNEPTLTKALSATPRMLSKTRAESLGACLDKLNLVTVGSNACRQEGATGVSNAIRHDGAMEFKSESKSGACATTTIGVETLQGEMTLGSATAWSTPLPPPAPQQAQHSAKPLRRSMSLDHVIAARPNVEPASPALQPTSRPQHPVSQLASDQQTASASLENAALRQSQSQPPSCSGTLKSSFIRGGLPSAKRRVLPRPGRDTGSVKGQTGGAPGALTVVFKEPRDAASWLLEVMAMMPTLPWPPELLEHPLCEELIIGGNRDSTICLPERSSTGALAPLQSYRSALALQFGGEPGATRSSFQAATIPRTPARVGGVEGPSRPGTPVTGPPRIPVGTLEVDSPAPGSAFHRCTSSASGVGTRAAGPADASALLTLRGLRARGAVVFGDLDGDMPPPGSMLCQMSYRGRGWVQSAVALSKSKPGRVTTNPETAALLPADIVAQLSVVKDV